MEHWHAKNLFSPPIYFLYSCSKHRKSFYFFTFRYLYDLTPWHTTNLFCTILLKKDRALRDITGWHDSAPRVPDSNAPSAPSTADCQNVTAPVKMSAADRPKWRRRKSLKSPADDDNDCASLAWLLNFRLDEFVNVKVPDDEPVKKEPKIMVPDGPPAPRKPPYTYPELIERALREKGELTVSAIYQWISWVVLFFVWFLVIP